MIAFAILNIETGTFYSESLILKKEAEATGQHWGFFCVIPLFARRYARHIDALRRSQKLSNKSGCVCAVVALP